MQDADDQKYPKAGPFGFRNGKHRQSQIPDHDADHHDPAGPPQTAPEDHRDGTQQGTDGVSSHQMAQPVLINGVNFLGHIGQQAHGNGVGRQINLKGQQHQGQNLRRLPDIGQAGLQLLPRGRPAAVSLGLGSGNTKGQGQTEKVESDHAHIGRANPQGGKQARPRQGTGDPGRVHGGARQTDGLGQPAGRHGIADQGIPHHQIRGPHQPRQQANGQHPIRAQTVQQGQDHDPKGQDHIAGPHDAQDQAAADPISDHAEKG